MKKPLIISTGASHLNEISEAVEAARAAGCRELVLLKCVASYPAPPQDTHLRTLPHMAEAFNVPVGLSDHTIGNGAAIASVAFGACLIEKHLTESRKGGGVDDAFSTEPHEFADLVKESERAWRALGKIHYGPLPSEAVTRSHRPSLYFVEDVPAGETLQPHHIRSVRPGKGLPPKEIDHIMGLSLAHAVKKGTPVQWSLFKI